MNIFNKLLSLAILGGLLLIHHQVASQTFEKWYEDNDVGMEHIPSSIADDPEGHYSIAVSMDKMNFQSWIMLTKVDPAGIPIGQKVLWDPNATSLTPIKIISAEHGNFVILAKTASNPDTKGSPVLIMIDQNLNVLWSQIYVDLDFSTEGWPWDIILDSRKNLVFVGHTGDAFGSFLPRSYMVVADQSGAMLHAHSYVDGIDANGGILATSVVESPDQNGYYITGNITGNATSYAGMPFLLKTATDCSFLFNSIYEGMTQQVNSIVELNSMLYAYGTQSQVIAFDLTGNPLNIVAVSSPDAILHGFEIRPADRNILICGGKFQSPSSDGGYFFEIDPSLGGVNSIYTYPDIIPVDLGPIFSGTGFFDHTYDQGNDIIYAGAYNNSTDDLGIVKASFQQPSCAVVINHIINNMQLIQVDRPLTNIGNFWNANFPVVYDQYSIQEMTVCQSPLLSTGTVETDVVQQERINVYPNPFTDVLSLTITADKSIHIAVSIKDIHGKQVANLSNATYHNGAYEFRWVPELSLIEGLYFAEITTDTQKSCHKLMYLK